MRLVASLLVATLACAGVAHGYTIESAASEGCHERISADALRVVRRELTTAAPLVPSRNEKALVEDVQFRPALDMRDLGGISLLLAVRDNDLKGRGSDDLTALAEIHGNPGRQMEHCLRDPGQIEPEGTAEAVADCRTFIHDQVLAALDGLAADGSIDLAQRTALKVHLSVRGGIDVSLPTFYVKLGAAMHALQDSFTHTYRSPDGDHVTVALNWIDYVNKRLDEPRDGPAHSADLDKCDDADPLRTARRTRATDASVDLLRVTLNPSLTREEKMTAVDALLDTYVGFTPGCTADNRWCDAPENDYARGTGLGCSTGEGFSLVAVVLALFLFGWRRAALGLALLLVVMPATGAHAGELEQGLTPPPAPTVPVAANAEPLPPHRTDQAWGFFVGLSGAFDQPALAGTVGARLRLSKHWALGLDGEWNPFLALNGRTFRAGAVNVYATAILRFPLAYENFNLRSTLSLGGSYLLSELYGAPEGSIGLYGGISPLGLEWKASRYVYVIINPASLAVPVPHLTGVPFVYPQYRFTLGFEFYGQ